MHWDINWTFPSSVVLYLAFKVTARVKSSVRVEINPPACQYDTHSQYHKEFSMQYAVSVSVSTSTHISFRIRVIAEIRLGWTYQVSASRVHIELRLKHFRIWGMADSNERLRVCVHVKNSRGYRPAFFESNVLFHISIFSSDGNTSKIAGSSPKC